MLKELFELVQGSSDQAVVNNPDIPNDHNKEVMAEATNTVASGFRNIVAGGGAQSLINLFTGVDKQQGQDEKSGVSSLMSNPIVSMMIGHFASKLMTKYKLGNNQASNVAASLIPSVIGGLINKNQSGDSTFSLQNLLASITGNKGSGGLDIGSIISQFTGGGQQQQTGGGGGLMDIVQQLAGGAQQQQQKNGGGGLMDLIKGFL